jgi:hypothetical protein
MNNLKCVKWLINVIFLGCMAVLNFSCSKEHLSDNSKVVVKDGIVYFQDREAFKSTMSELNTNNELYLEQWEKKIGFKNSYRRLLDSLANDTSISDFEYTKLENTIPDICLATIVNEHGVYVLNDTIHKITMDMEYIIPNLNFSQLNKIELSSTNLKSLNSDIQIFEIQRRLFTSNDPDGQIPGNLKSVSGNNVIKKNSDNSEICRDDISAHLKAWCINTAVYGSVGIKITGRKLKNRKWKDDPMWYAKVEGIAYWGTPAGPGFCGGDKEKRNDKNVGVTMGWYLGIVTCAYIDATYTYEDDGCAKLSWDIHWE